MHYPNCGANELLSRSCSHLDVRPGSPHPRLDPSMQFAAGTPACAKRFPEVTAAFGTAARSLTRRLKGFFLTAGWHKVCVCVWVWSWCRNILILEASGTFWEPVCPIHASPGWMTWWVLTWCRTPTSPCSCIVVQISVSQPGVRGPLRVLGVVAWCPWGEGSFF